MQKAEQTAGAVSYASFSGTHYQKGINEVSIDGAAATEDNVKSGKYSFWSYEHVYTNGPPTKDVVKFIVFISSNGALMDKTGDILVKDMKVSETDR